MSTTTSIFPSATTWTTPRTDEIKLTTDNCKLFTNSKIDKLQKILCVPIAESGFQCTITLTPLAVLQNVKIEQIFLDETLTQPLATIGLDITKYVVEKAKYNTLSTIPNSATYPDYFQELYVNNTAYWTQSSNEIKLINTPFNGWFEVIPHHTFDVLLLSALVDLINSQGIYVQMQSGVVQHVTSETLSKIVSGTDNLDVR